MFAVRGGMLVGVPVPSMFYRENNGHWYIPKMTSQETGDFPKSIFIIVVGEYVIGQNNRRAVLA